MTPGIVQALHPGDEPRPLPTLPIVVARLLALYASESYTKQQVVHVLETDPALAARVLRLANSAYYGFTRKVETLGRATVLLGRATVQAVALGATLLKTWSTGRLPAEVESIWVHSYLCGQGCRYLGLRLPRHGADAQPDALFLAGLLHDVGKIVLLSQAPEEYVEILTEHPAGEALREAERERFGQDHAHLGGDLLRSWNLPERLAVLVEFHHEGELRDAYAADLDVLRTSNQVLGARAAERTPTGVPAALARDLGAHFDKVRAEAEAFYRAIC